MHIPSLLVRINSQGVTVILVRFFILQNSTELLLKTSYLKKGNTLTQQISIEHKVTNLICFESKELLVFM